MNEAEPIEVDIRWPEGKVALSFLPGRVLGAWDEYPVRIAVAAGAFRGEAQLDVIGLPEFLEDLDRLYETLSGEANLMGWDERRPLIKFTARGNGHVGIAVRLPSDQFSEPDATLQVLGDLDQSYLPPLLEAFRKAASARPEPASSTVAMRRTLVPRGVLQWAAAAVLTLVPVGILIGELFRPDPDTVFLIRGGGALFLIAMLATLGERELRAGR